MFFQLLRLLATLCSSSDSGTRTSFLVLLVLRYPLWAAFPSSHSALSSKILLCHSLYVTLLLIPVYSTKYSTLVQLLGFNRPQFQPPLVILYFRDLSNQQNFPLRPCAVVPPLRFMNLSYFCPFHQLNSLFRLTRVRFSITLFIRSRFCPFHLASPFLFQSPGLVLPVLY